MSRSYSLDLWICYFTWQKGLGGRNYVQDLEMLRLTWFMCVAQCNHNGLSKREARGEVRREDGTVEIEEGVMSFKGGGRGHEPRNTGSL